MSLADKIRGAQIRAGEDAVTEHLRELGLVEPESKPRQQKPTCSMRAVRYQDGSYGVEMNVTGLVSERQAEAAMNHMQNLFCGAEIAEH